MKDDVQKPIQSLHAFMCHHFGGGLFFPPLIFRGVLLVALAVCGVSAQESGDSNKQVSNEKRLDLLFDQIMQTLPEGARSKVDSAATVKTDRRPVSGVTSAGKMDHITAHSPRERLSELPDDLKAQVERAITDMEQRKEERKAQFRDSRRNR
jgi:hypothetical protein